MGSGFQRMIQHWDSTSDSAIGCGVSIPSWILGMFCREYMCSKTGSIWSSEPHPANISLIPQSQGGKGFGGACQFLAFHMPPFPAGPLTDPLALATAPLPAPERERERERETVLSYSFWCCHLHFLKHCPKWAGKIWFQGPKWPTFSVPAHDRSCQPLSQHWGSTRTCCLPKNLGQCVQRHWACGIVTQRVGTQEYRSLTMGFLSWVRTRGWWIWD